MTSRSMYAKQEVSPEFISSVTDAVMAEVGAWQSRPLEPMYPVIFFDALRVKIREDAVVRNKAIYSGRFPLHFHGIDLSHFEIAVLEVRG